MQVDYDDDGKYLDTRAKQKLKELEKKGLQDYNRRAINNFLPYPPTPKI